MDPNTTSNTPPPPLSPADLALQTLLEEHPELAGKIHTCLSDGQLKQILQSQDDLQRQFGEGQKLIEAVRESLGRIFELYEKHDGEIDTLKIDMAAKKATNGNTETTMRSMKEKDDKLDDEIQNIKTDISGIKTDIAVIKTAVLSEEKQKDRKWLTRNNIIVGIIIGTAVFMVTMFITFMVKTFIWGY